ncbi:hypothetical protein VHEMI10345 [[Torrubiella] hemipterigena]|uniref:MARVEL domain-containing protein n=1 Tax=[Torrubiella] hemipterigena TaxID=1531966 RepID=A0A0A1TT52_9HYPO|nr:hypothetical protein VHEMI10345 [[Torrubiella] hemipterigena]
MARTMGTRTIGSSTLSGSSVVYEEHVISHVRTYNWPPLQLNFWIFVMLLASTSIVGVFSTFIQIQTQLYLPIPWYFPYFITVAALVIVFVATMIWLIANRRLLPAIVMIGSFLLFILWMVGLISTAVELWGPTGSVAGNCQLQVFNQNPTGATMETLAWLQQKSICKFMVLVSGSLNCSR